MKEPSIFFVDCSIFFVFQKLKEMLTVKQKVLQLAKEAGFNEVDS